MAAQEIAKAIRNHWGIENRNHYVRDVTFREDASRIRKKPGHFARLRNVALNLLRANRVTNIAA
jgi:predicted transposase YbfD/YdcC